ncbi:MAG: circularly permuted type 2 ATP-grasp protein, partial [Gemmatimonadota bacterium]|nr:circularly permuted type 2 ATP-grasp protein [Gemmatimonadota bacterium]
MSKTPIADIMPEGYAIEPGSYDEMWDPKDGVRAHWHPFFRAIERMGSKELARRHQEARLRENGVTYNGDPDGLHHPWELDPIPLLLQANDWTHIARGVSQRAELLNLVLKDIYGPQTLIREGLLPFELIYNHAGLLKPRTDISLPAAHACRVYADLIPA